MMRSTLSRSSLLALLAMAGCSGSARTVAPDAGGSDAGGSDAIGSDAGAPDAATTDATHSPGDRAPGCPETPPQDKTPCPPVVAPNGPGSWPCEYGSDPHCTTIAQCISNDGHTYAWFVSPPDPSCSGNPAGCPAEFDAGAGGACPVAGPCAYPQGRCACGLCNQGGVCAHACGDSDGGDGGGPQTDWQCLPWPPTTGCPEPRPLLGTPCTTERQTCNGVPCYCSRVDVGPGLECTGGYWNFVNGGC